MAETRLLRVFLCHASTDKPKVRTLYRRLVDDGFDPWLDEEKLVPGQDWEYEIRAAVQAAHVVVVCLTRNSVNKEGYVQKEIRIALDVADEKPEGTIYIIPARFEDCPVPERLSRWQWVNVYDKNGYRKLYRSLELRAQSLGIQIASTPQPIPKQKLIQIPSVSLPIPEDKLAEIRLPIEPQLVRVPAGPFPMGSTDKDKESFEDEKPQHTVELSEYWIGKYPVTNLEFQAFVKEAGYQPPRHWDGNQYPAEKGDHPVVNVSWEDAAAYCRWLGEKAGKMYRLPTEAEWEKAARGTDGRIFPWGNNFDQDRCNTAEAGIRDTTPVGKYSPAGDSPYGCADMAGNVWEWCADWLAEGEYRRRAQSTVKDPLGPGKGTARVLRGGSFLRRRRLARCAFRVWSDPDLGYGSYGFRVVVSPLGGA